VEVIIATDLFICAECAEIIKFLSVVLLCDLHSSLKCGALAVPNNSYPQTENSQLCDYLSLCVDGKLDLLFMPFWNII